MKQSVPLPFFNGLLSCVYVCLAGCVVFDRDVCELRPPLESPILAKSEVLLDEDSKIIVCLCARAHAALCGSVCFDNIC